MRIILPFCRDVPYGFYWDFLQGVTDALAERGDEAVRFPMAKVGEHDAAEMTALYRELERGCDLFLDLCSWGYGLTRMGVPRPSAPPVPLLDAFGIRYAGMLFDQPYFQPINVAVARQLYATFPDLGHREQAEFVFPDLALAGHVFAPPATRAANARPAERDIDVLYFGNLDLEQRSRPWRSGPLAAVGETVAQLVEEHPERPFHRAVREVMLQQQKSASSAEIAELVRAMELFIRVKFRQDVVVAMASAGLRLVVVGRGWERVALPANAKCLAPLDYDDMFKLAGRSRICLDASTYLNGANDRVFNYALNGAVCFTNATGYLGKEDWLCFYSMRELDALADSARALLGNPRQLQEMGQRAKQAVLARHTWRDRVETILTATCPSSSPRVQRAP
jgi:hypothetical protein